MKFLYEMLPFLADTTCWTVMSTPNDYFGSILLWTFGSIRHSSWTHWGPTSFRYLHSSKLSCCSDWDINIKNKIFKIELIQVKYYIYPFCIFEDQENLILKNYLLICKSKLQREREEKTETEILHLLVAFLNDHNGQGWAKSKPRASSRSFMWLQGPSSWAILCPLSQAIYRKLDQKWSSRV